MSLPGSLLRPQLLSNTLRKPIAIIVHPHGLNKRSKFLFCFLLKTLHSGNLIAVDWGLRAATGYLGPQPDSGNQPLDDMIAKTQNGFGSLPQILEE
jgi:hypothetical protein